MDERFWIMDYFTEDHEVDLLSSSLSCIVDEEAGGIIAYVVDDEFAEMIVEALNA